MYLSEISTESCKKITARINTTSGFFTTRNRSCGKEMHVSVILYTGSSTIPPCGQPPLKTRYSTLRPDSLLWPDPPSTLGPDPLLPPRPEPPGGKNMGPDRMWHHTPWKIMGPDRKWTPPEPQKTRLDVPSCDGHRKRRYTSCWNAFFVIQFYCAKQLRSIIILCQNITWGPKSLRLWYGGYTQPGACGRYICKQCAWTGKLQFMQCTN